ncbi:monofunctional biosynthetic peptidoglycan transglycosylase [Paracoccus pacificus]|uniref:Biosynthetic peptidoglycan transglycosylase n=1 Tax=Paracoccus pacificus TaxID=1463598 RepID=A0ABW4R7U7_9RHOB
MRRGFMPRRAEPLTDADGPSAAPTRRRRGGNAPEEAIRPVRRGFWRRLRWLALRLLLGVVLIVGSCAFVNPPTTWTILTGQRDYPGIDREWTPIEDIAPSMVRSVVAAEDANFCRHWGFDMTEIRKVIDRGSTRGASTISQQVAKNVFLWQGRSWPRKAMEALLTPVVEATWSKRRIVEVYLNVAEFGPGVFGVHAAAAQYFGTTPDKLTAKQSARLAMVLPSPKTRDAARPTPDQRRRSAAIVDGAATIAVDGRDDCLGLE